VDTEERTDRGKLTRRVELTRGSYVEYYEAIPGLKPVVRYKRLSVKKLDPKVNRRAMERQDCIKELAKTKACVVAEYCDPDHSAYKYHYLDENGVERGKARPAFEVMVAEYRSLGTGLCAADIDRLTRQPLTLEVLIRHYETTSRLVFITKDETVDLTTDQGRSRARDKIKTALEEAKAAQRRQKDRHEQLAEEGEYVHTRPVFGLTATGDLEGEASKLILEAVGWVRDGNRLGTLLAKWGTRGVVSPQGNPWTCTTFKRVLSNPRLCGWRVDNRRNPETGKLVSPDRVRRDDDGNPCTGGMVALITPEVWLDVQAKLKASPHAHNGRKTKHMFSLKFRCSEKGCAGRLTGYTRGATKGHMYECSDCGKVRVTGVPTDRLMLKLLQERVTSSPLQAFTVDIPDWPKEAEAARHRAGLVDLKVEYEAGEVEDDVYLDKSDDLRTVIRKLDRERAAWVKAHTTKVPAKVTEVDWENPDHDAVGALWDQYVKVCFVSRSPKKGRGAWSVDRFDLKWN
jgi:DNA invertase Pin-like site-specific DNA recombinase